MKFITVSLLAAALAAPLSATQYFFGDFTTTLEDSSGTPWSVSLDLELGAFTGGFVPTASNMSEWASYWTAGPLGFYDPSGPEWGAQFTLNDNALLPVGSPLYLMAWGNLIGPATEVALFSDAAWQVGVNDPLDLFPVFLEFSEDSFALVGSFDWSAGLAGTAAVNFTPVPEPSTWGLAGALALLSVAVWRRRRQNALAAQG
ncbi:MAG TPA: PEP-CTERM sorting domain-containing protein [Candidatus Synoicihabitans sp.]|nr:PEP-CTERM sorting domain-containing protein [Candidatus Synoicihabitans sp.]